MSHRRGFLTGFGAGALTALAVAALITAVAGDFRDPDLTSQVSEVIRDDYYKPVEGSVLDSASVDGIIRELRKRYDDRITHYLDPQELRLFEAAAAGRFSGVGLTVTGVKRGLRVASVLPDTPAERARIEEGDLITAVNGRSLAGVPARRLHRPDQGPAGTPVNLRVVSGSGGRTRNVDLERASVELPVARGEIGGQAPPRSPTSSTRASERGHTASYGRRSSVSTAAAPRAWSSTCGATEAGC